MVSIVTTSPGFGKYGRVPDLIAARGWDFQRATDVDSLAPLLARADFLVVGLPVVDAATLAAAPALKGVLKHGVGTDNIDIPACTSRGLPVVNTPAANADAVAELALGLAFAMARTIPQGHASVASGGWERRGGIQLGGRVMGILGFGNIGRRLAHLARGIGMQIIACDPYADVEAARALGVEIVDFDGLLTRSDVLSIHVFGGPGNEGLFKRETLARMKPGAMLANLARGEVLDQDAVAEALNSGHLRAVALDAHLVEPPVLSHPLYAHPNAIFTPHSGADTLEAFENMGLMVIEDIDTLLTGALPARCLNAAQLPR
ncbi:hydroxyacid dehydrogenase [Cereibacter sphaeroides]|nr:hydroxyacid dehydrogenase [Cereibacter sphaeroides]